MTYEHRDNQDRNHSREDGNKTQLFIAKGRNDGMDSGALVEFISAETNIGPDQISNVKVLDAFSFFAVDHDEAGRILDHFQAKAGEGRPLVSKAKRKKPNDGGGYNDRREGGYGGGNRDRDSGYGRRDDRNSDRPRRDFGGDRNRDDRGGSRNSDNYGNSGSYGNSGNRNNY